MLCPYEGFGVTSCSLEFAADVLDDAIANQNLNLHLLDQVVALRQIEETINLALVDLLVHLQHLYLLELLQGLVLLVEHFALALGQLALNILDLLLHLRPLGVGALLLDLSDHLLGLHIHLLELAVNLVDLILKLLLGLFFPAGRHHSFDVDGALQQKLVVCLVHRFFYQEGGVSR